MSVRSWLDSFRHPAVTVTDNTAPGIVMTGMNRREVEALLAKVGTFTASDLMRTQPELQAAVKFLARNVAQLGLHAYVVDGDDGRKRDRESLLARVLDNPSPAQTQYELVYSIVADLALFDECWLLLTRARSHDTGWVLRPIPPAAVKVESGSEWTGDLVVSVALDGREPVKITADELIHLKGWNPAYGSDGTPPIDALKTVLSEQIAAQAYRLGVWKNGGQVSAFISRPKDAPEWSENAQRKFTEGMKAYRAGGAAAGGMPVLEDGMRIETNRLSAKEEQFIEAAQLSLETVARVFHIAPAMLGATGGVTYANMREFRRGLYGETLGPILVQVEQKLTKHLLPTLSAPAGTYLEFNLKAKMAGSFEEEADVLFKSTGAPFMTVNEARARQNLPRVDGGDVLQSPLNMAPADQQGGADPEADPEPAERSGSTAVDRKAKAEPHTAEPVEGQRTQDMILGVLTRHAQRQRQVVLARINSKDATDWWDAERWDRELADDLQLAAQTVVQTIGYGVARDLGYGEAWDPQSTVNFLRAVAESRAGMINAATKDAIVEALGTGEGEGPTVEDVFNDLEGARGQTSALTLHSTLAAFAGVEAAKHVKRSTGGGRATKTWLVRSGNPRKSHSRMHGQTVDIDAVFSNGANWPGDPVLGADGVAGCLCSVEVSVEI